MGSGGDHRSSRSVGGQQQEVAQAVMAMGVPATVQQARVRGGHSRAGSVQLRLGSSSSEQLSSSARRRGCRTTAA